MRMISILGLIALPSVFVKTVVCLTKATSPFPTARHLNWQERWSNHQGKGQCSSQKTITSLRFCYVVDSCGLQCSELWRLNQHLKSVCFFFFLFFLRFWGSGMFPFTWRHRRIHHTGLVPSHTCSVLSCLPHTAHTGWRGNRAGWRLAHSSPWRTLPPLSIMVNGKKRDGKFSFFRPTTICKYEKNIKCHSIISTWN